MTSAAPPDVRSGGSLGPTLAAVATTATVVVVVFWRLGFTGLLLRLLT
ncbi:hypothetical protein AB0M43_24025 [Longispora sp. NPDC051575]